MAAQSPRTTDKDHRVIPFRRRAAVGGNSDRRAALSGPQSPVPPVEGLAKYEGGEADDDYRHRMMVNLAALAVTVMLALAGGWLAIQIAQMRKDQDCALSGRRNCAPIDVKAAEGNK